MFHIERRTVRGATFCMEANLKYPNEALHSLETHEGEIIVNENEIRKLLKRADAELRKVDERMIKFHESRSVSIFTENEKKAWLRTEPNFSKPIIERAKAVK